MTELQNFVPDLMAEMRRLAIIAGHEILKIYQSDDFGIKTKSDESPVTLADEAADAIISAGLSKRFADIPLVTEEQAQSHRGSHDRFLIVDPLDGTKEFIHKSGEFTVNIALVENGVPLLGVVYAPALGRLFYTDTRSSAVEELAPFDENNKGRCKQIKVTEPDNDALVVVASKSHRDAATDKYISLYKVADFTSAGSSLKFCLLATGEADFYPRLGRTMEWDTAAGDALLRAAGGHVVDFETKLPLLYGKSDYANPFFIAFAQGVKLQEEH